MSKYILRELFVKHPTWRPFLSFYSNCVQRESSERFFRAKSLRVPRETVNAVVTSESRAPQASRHVSRKVLNRSSSPSGPTSGGNFVTAAAGDRHLNSKSDFPPQFASTARPEFPRMNDRNSSRLYWSHAGVYLTMAQDYATDLHLICVCGGFSWKIPSVLNHGEIFIGCFGRFRRSANPFHGTALSYVRLEERMRNSLATRRGNVIFTSAAF